MKPPKPTGRPFSYPVCGRWDCDDWEDWETVTPDDEEYSAAKRERDIVDYHQPRNDWPRRLQEERDRRNGGEPLWVRRT